MSESDPIFVSFFTRPYAEEAAGLVESLNRVGLEHQVAELADRGSWEANCNAKAAFIDRELHLRSRPTVWLDADARVLKRPKLLLDLAGHPRIDFAARVREEGILSGTLLFNPTDGAAELLRRWIDACERNPNDWDQRNLTQAYAQAGSHLFVLPDEYCHIDKTDGDASGAVIFHRQASRRLKPLRKVHA